MQICLLTKRKIGNWHIYGQAYHSMIWKTFNISGEDWQLAAIPKRVTRKDIHTNEKKHKRLPQATSCCVWENFNCKMLLTADSKLCLLLHLFLRLHISYWLFLPPPKTNHFLVSNNWVMIIKTRRIMSSFNIS